MGDDTIYCEGEKRRGNKFLFLALRVFAGNWWWRWGGEELSLSFRRVVLSTVAASKGDTQ